MSVLITEVMKTNLNNNTTSNLECRQNGRSVQNRKISFHDSWSRKSLQTSFYSIRMSRPKSFNISRSPNARASFWCQNISIYGALMLLNFCGDWRSGLGARTKLFKVSDWKKLLGSKVLGICLKLSLAKKFFPKNHPRPKNSKKWLSTHFFANFLLVMISWVILN